MTEANRYIKNTDRHCALRAVLTGAAAAALSPAAVVAAGIEPAPVDPIYAAIARWQEAQDAFLARCYIEEDLEASGVKLQPAPGDFRTPEIAAAVAASIAAREALARTVPGTAAGLLAVLQFVREWSADGDEFFFRDNDDVEITAFLNSIETAVRGMAAPAAIDPVFAVIEQRPRRAGERQ